MSTLLLSVARARSLLACLVLTQSFAELLGGEALEERRLMPVSDSVGAEQVEALELASEGLVRVAYRDWYEYLDVEGRFLLKRVKGEAYVYSPNQDRVVDFVHPETVVVRDRVSDATVYQYPLVRGGGSFLGGFVSGGGELCQVAYYPEGWTVFDISDGKVLWTEESVGWSYKPLGEGNVVVRFTHLVHIPEAEFKYYGPVSESLRHARTGEIVLPTEAEGGWLLPKVSASGQAVYVSDDIWLVDTETAQFKSISLEGKRVRNRVAAQSLSGEAVAALVFSEVDGAWGDFEWVSWNVDEGSERRVVWDDSWGEPNEALSLSVSDDGKSVVWCSIDRDCWYLDLDTGESRLLQDGVEAAAANVRRIAEIPFHAFVEEGTRLVLVDSIGGLRIVDTGTSETLFQADGVRQELFDFVSGERGIFVAEDWTLRAIDFGSLEVGEFVEGSVPRIEEVWPIDDDGRATVFFADGSRQDFDTEFGQLVGERVSVMPSHVGLLDSDSESRLLVGDDARVYDADTGEILFDLPAALESGAWRPEYRMAIRETLDDATFGAKLIRNGSQLLLSSRGFGDPIEQGLVAALELETGSLSAFKRYNWAEVWENEDFLVAVERVPQAADRSALRLSVFDFEDNLAEVYGVALYGKYQVSPDGRFFATVSSDFESVEGDSLYEAEVRLREFEIRKNGFRELDATVWTKVYEGTEADLGVPHLLEYFGPEGSAIVVTRGGKVVDLRGGEVSEWREGDNVSWYGSRILDRTIDGSLLILDNFGRLGIYAHLVPTWGSIDVKVDRDGYAVPILSTIERDRSDVCWSHDLKNWEVWDGVPIRVVPDAPVFFRAIEWVRAES